MSQEPFDKGKPMTGAAVAKAVSLVCRELRKDKGWWDAYQCNIAMAFKDEMGRRGYRLPDLHEIANAAATNFMQMWTAPQKKARKSNAK